MTQLGTCVLLRSGSRCSLRTVFRQRAIHVGIMVDKVALKPIIRGATVSNSNDAP